MGRRKLEIKRIEDKGSRHVTFSKRRSGLIKKSHELSVLCDVEVGLLVFSSTGRLYEFCSGDNSLASILERHRNHNQEASTSKATGDGLGCQSDYSARTRSYTELLQIVQRLTEGSDASDVSDLDQLEKELNSALVETRCRKTLLSMESVMTLQEKEMLLREEKEMIEREVASLLLDNNNDCGGGQNSKNRYLSNNKDESADDHPHPQPQTTLNLLGCSMT